MNDCQRTRRIGIIGFGHLGQFLVDAVLQNEDLQLAFVWNRTSADLKDQVDRKYVLDNLEEFHDRNADLIVEVAHPVITEMYGERFLQHSDYMIGSPTALADAAVERKLTESATSHGLYVPSGAFWGGEDIRKMADRQILQALKVTMTFHPHSFRLKGVLKDKNDAVVSQKKILYQGSVRDLCPLAPNNVNTMAAACTAAHTLGFDGVQGCLVSDPGLTDYHIVEVDVWGPGDIDSGTAFHVHTTRKNPARTGQVTGSATYNTFLSSMLGAAGRGPGVHLC